MRYLQLTKKGLTGKLVACTNFADNSFVNLIKLDKPYKDGTSYSVHETTKSAFCSNGLFKDLEQAIVKYNRMVLNGTQESPIRNQFTKIGEYVNLCGNHGKIVLSFKYQYQQIDNKVFRIEPNI
jgi:hypothetical protein